MASVKCWELVLICSFKKKIYFGVPRCTVKKLFVVTSGVRGEICGRHPIHAPQTAVRLHVVFFSLSISPLHLTRASTSGDPDLSSSLLDFFSRS